MRWSGLNRAEPHGMPHSPLETISALPPFESKEESGLICYSVFTSLHKVELMLKRSVENRKDVEKSSDSRIDRLTFCLLHIMGDLLVCDFLINSI